MFEFLHLNDLKVLHYILQKNKTKKMLPLTLISSLDLIIFFLDASGLFIFYFYFWTLIHQSLSDFCSPSFPRLPPQCLGKYPVLEASLSIPEGFLQFPTPFRFLKPQCSSRQKTFGSLEYYFQEVQSGGTHRKHSKHREVKSKKDVEQGTQRLEAPRESHYLLLVYFSYIQS